MNPKLLVTTPGDDPPVLSFANCATSVAFAGVKLPVSAVKSALSPDQVPLSKDRMLTKPLRGTVVELSVEEYIVPREKLMVTLA